MCAEIQLFYWAKLHVVRFLITSIYFFYLRQFKARSRYNIAPTLTHIHTHTHIYNIMMTIAHRIYHKIIYNITTIM